MTAQAVLDRPRERVPGRRDVHEFRSSGGRLAAAPGAPVLLLSRLSQTSPLLYLPDQDDPDLVHVLASAPGGDPDSAWVRHVLSRPDDLAVEIGRTTTRARGRLLLEHERAAVAARWSRLDPLVDQHQRTSGRSTPVIALTLQQGS